MNLRKMLKKLIVSDTYRMLENLLVCRCGDVLCLQENSATNFLKTHAVHGGVFTL